MSFLISYCFITRIAQIVLPVGMTAAVRAGDKHQRSSSDPQSPSSQPPRRRPRQAARAPDSTSEREEEESSGHSDREQPVPSTSVVEQYLAMQADRDLAGGFSTLPQQQFAATGTSGKRKSSRRGGKSSTPAAGPSRQ